MATNDERDEEFRRIANRIQYTYSGPATTLTTSMSITWGEVERSTEPSWRGTHYFSTASVVPGNRIYFTNPSQWGYYRWYLWSPQT